MCTKTQLFKVGTTWDLTLMLYYITSRCWHLLGCYSGILGGDILGGWETGGCLAAGEQESYWVLLSCWH